MAADKFDISTLKLLARSRISSWLYENARQFPLVVREIWTTNPPLEIELRDAIIKSISGNPQKFLIHDESTAIMTDIPELTIAVLRKVVEENCSHKPEHSIFEKGRKDSHCDDPNKK